MNLAPASTALLSCSFVITVPAPTIISGTFSAICLMASSAAAVLKVTSQVLIPPASKAFARGTALLASSSTTTGITPQFSIILFNNINTS